MLLWFIFLFCLGIAWIGYEMWRAPLLDENYKVIRSERKLSHLFKKQTNGRKSETKEKKIS